MAATSGGFHYKYIAGRWSDTKDGSEFFATLSRCASEQSGRALQFSA
jgi:CyaY protein